MKRCPECRRDYSDETLNYCLDDGAELLDGPALSEKPTKLFPTRLDDAPVDREPSRKDPVTQVLPINAPTVELSRRRRVFLAGTVVIVMLIGLFSYIYVSTSFKKAESTSQVPPPTLTKLYWEMSEEEKFAFIGERAKHIQRLIGDEEVELENAALLAIKREIEYYVEDRDSLSQKPFEEGLRAVYGRGTQFAPVVIRAFEEQNVPAALGLYQAMIESEYHDCLEPSWEGPGRGPIGLFQFSRQTGSRYGMKPTDFCNVRKQCDAAARYMSDLISDFGSEKSSWTLALLSFNQGGEQVRDNLRRLRTLGVTERSFWAIFRHQNELQTPMIEEANSYVPRFFAAAIIGETPANFDLSTPPLTTLRK